ncbi:MAG: sugar ABC transporter ATP-binding protein [Ruminococcaceae bacterium]|nr:sugar ABC transporter ATP-binding protein [Oscillospiraceae bacterium]
MSVLSREILGIFCGECGIPGFDGIFKNKNVKMNGKAFINGEQADIKKLYDFAGFANDSDMIIDELSVAENVFLGRIRQHERFARVNTVSLFNQSRRALSEVGLSHISPDFAAKSLTVGEKKLLEIAKILSDGKKVIFLKDFFVSLNLDERYRVVKVLRKFTVRGGSVVLFSNDLDELKCFCDRIVFFDDRGPQRIYNSDEFCNISTSQNRIKKATPNECEVTFRAINLCLPYVFSNVNIRLCKGEILGILGLKNSGIHELSEVLCGALMPERGRLTVKGRRIKSIREAHKRKLVYVKHGWEYDDIMDILTCSGAQIFVMDTVLEGLSVEQSTRIENVMRDICSRGGAIIYVSQYTNRLIRICDRIAVMRRGVISNEFCASDGYSKPQIDKAVLT